MRAILTALLAVGGFGMAVSGSAQTAVSQYPFCMQGDDNPGWSGCSFDSLQACQASASGTFSECLSNPWYVAGNSGPSAPDLNPAGPNAPIAIGPPPNMGNK
jgi:hypothetical protein